jgi:hypothetical protein
MTKGYPLHPTAIERIHRVSPQDVPHVDLLTEQDIWTKHTPGTHVWRARSFQGHPHFYPVYNWSDFYSYSPLALILLKGRFILNPSIAREAAKTSFLHHHAHANETIDAEVVRIGGPLPLYPKSERTIRTEEEYAEQIASALRSDIAIVENANPGAQNIVFCGGRDSLTLLLLPWRNPLMAISADPNYELVCRFVDGNRLGIDVRRLEDLYDPEELEFEVLENCCRGNLQHYRWGAHLREIAASFLRPVIFWKGQVAGALTTPHWKKHTYYLGNKRGYIDKAYSRIDRFLPHTLQDRIAETILLPRLAKMLWIKSAMFQGCHMPLIRVLTDSLVLSGYHGPAMRELFRRVDYVSAAQSDIRARYGDVIFGKPVIFPDINPAPSPSPLRVGLSHPKRFIDQLGRIGIPIELDGVVL